MMRNIDIDLERITWIPLSGLKRFDAEVPV